MNSFPALNQSRNTIKARWNFFEVEKNTVTKHYGTQQVAKVGILMRTNRIRSHAIDSFDKRIRGLNNVNTRKKKKKKENYTSIEKFDVKDRRYFLGILVSRLPTDRFLISTRLLASTTPIVVACIFSST